MKHKRSKRITKLSLAAHRKKYPKFFKIQNSSKKNQSRGGETKIRLHMVYYILQGQLKLEYEKLKHIKLMCRVLYVKRYDL
jgi:hypothetical protein